MKTDKNTCKTYMNSKADINIFWETIFGIDNANLQQKEFVLARGFAIPKCEVKFESVVIDDDRKLLICFNNLRIRQFVWNVVW